MKRKIKSIVYPSQDHFDENVVKINLHQYSTDYFSRKYKNCEYSCDDGHERQTLLSQHKLFPSCKEA